MKIVLLVLFSIVFVGCTNNSSKDPEERKLNKKVEIKKHLDGQFIFQGDKKLVEKYMMALGGSHKILPIREKTQIYQVVYENDLDLKSVMSGLEGRVDSIQPNYVYDLLFEMNMRKWTKDKHRFHQWYLNNVGQAAPFGLPGKRGSDIDIYRAWDNGKVTGSRDIVVAVVDTGVDYEHEDLIENMWVNEAEKNGVAGVDEDGNGYTDDVYGYDFYSANSSKLYYGKPGDPDPMDENGHGTHCAGVIGARANNDLGIAGINWNVQIMALKIFGKQGGANSGDIQRAIYYAVDKKVDVMNNSWGSAGNGDDKVRQAIEEANKAGILFVAASGNDGENSDVKQYTPAGYREHKDRTKRLENIISVGATDNQDNPAVFSNFGYESVDVFAPGVLIVSSYPKKLKNSGGGPYVIMSGTSMAAPVVSGVAALVLSANPQLKGKPGLLKKVLIETSDTIQGLVGKNVANGRINAYRAVNFIKENSGLLSNWTEESYKIEQRGFSEELYDIRHKVTKEGAKAIRVHFNFVDIIEPYNSVYFYDKNMRFVSSLARTSAIDLWSPVIPGDTMFVRYVNSTVKRMKMLLDISKKNASECLSAGGTIIYEGGKESCQVDSINSSSGGGSEVFNSFRSEGFTVDKVSYLN